MTKPEVLAIVGSPWRTGREHGQDRWVYVNRSEEAHDGENTFIFFSEGRVTYIGPSDEARAQAAPTATTDKAFKPVGE